jgi:hypothetical protein
MGYVTKRQRNVGDLAREHGERSAKVGLVTKQGDRFVRVEDPAPSVPNQGMAGPAGQQTIAAFDYETAKPGDRTPDGMIFVTTIKSSSKKTALLRTDFNRMSHYDAEAKAEAEKHLDRRLPDMDELDMIRSAMTKKEIKALDGLKFAWSAKRNVDHAAGGMYLDGGSRYWIDRDILAQVCLVRSVDL